MPKRAKKRDNGENSTKEDPSSSTLSESQSLLTNADSAADDNGQSANMALKIDKTGLYDMQQVKRLVDDEIIAFMEESGYEELTLTSNVKLIAGTIAVIAALYSHFGVGDWVSSRNSVLICVVIYIVCTAAINISSFLFEASAMFVGRLKSSVRSTNSTLPEYAWVHTSFAGKGSSVIKVELRRSVRSKIGGVEEEYAYEQFFTTEGLFLKEPFRRRMVETLAKVGKKSN